MAWISASVSSVVVIDHPFCKFQHLPDVDGEHVRSPFGERDAASPAHPRVMTAALPLVDKAAEREQVRQLRIADGARARDEGFPEIPRPAHMISPAIALLRTSWVKRLPQPRRRNES